MLTFLIMQAVILSLFVVLCITFTTAQLSGYWGPSDLTAIQAQCREITSQSSSAKDIYFALQLLKQLNPNDKSCQCDKLQKLAKADSESIMQVAYAVRAADACGCPFEPSARALETVRSSLKVSKIFCSHRRALTLVCRLIPS